MACPLFIPVSPLGDLVSVTAPLGDIYGGNCAAEPMAAIEPDTLRRYCNFGYARGHCTRAAQSDADAVRLLVRSSLGTVVEIAWAVERNHHPVAVGSLEIDLVRATSHTADTLTLQARACATAYARQTHAGPVYVGQIAAAAHQ